jgi:hypothetical protein
MSEAPDPLETELSALRPREVSPELRRRVAERLAESSPARRRWLWRIAVAGGLAAAFVAAILFGRRAGRRDEPAPIPVVGQPALAVEVKGTFPTLIEYERALARSPEELDSLLKRDAGSAPANRELVSMFTVTRSDAQLRELLGEN